jgi:lipoic acid synthetase
MAGAPEQPNPLPRSRTERVPKPRWLKVKMPGGPRYTAIKARARTLKLHTVCEEARCPNIGECWGGGTATFMVMGGICTRGCRFCAVTTKKHGMPLDPLEPENLGSTIAEMDLDYVVVTSVDRDDLPDQGAGHFAACVRETRRQSPKTMVEVLIPDFRGDLDLLHRVVDAQPDVIAHNIECTEALTSRVRDPRAGYRQSLAVLQGIKDRDPTRYTKSSIMVGFGAPERDIVQTMRDLRAVGCDFLTVGQYLQPTKKHLPVTEFVPPEQFDRYRDLGLEMGFHYVASGPLVRSSYKAGEYFIREFVQKQHGTTGGLLGHENHFADIAGSLLRETP